jgi:hypothetical protein
VLPRGRNFSRRTQKGPYKIFAARKIGGRIFLKYAKKKAEKGPNFFEDDYSLKNLKISAEKYTSPDIYDVSFPLPREIVCKRK